METTTIKLAAGIELEKQNLLFKFIEGLKKICKTEKIEYSYSEKTCFVRCDVINVCFFEFEKIFEMVFHDFKISKEQLSNSKIKPKEVTDARKIISLLLRFRYDFTYQAIATFIGLKCHATIMMMCRGYGLKRDEKIKTEELAVAYKRIKNLVLSRRRKNQNENLL